MKHATGRVAAICALLAMLPAMASAQTLSYVDSYGPTSTGYSNHSETFTLPGFDPSLGTLNSVTVIYSGQILNSVMFENLGNAYGSPSGHVFNMEAEHGIGLLALGVDPGDLDPFQSYNELDPAVWGDSGNFIASSTYLQEVERLTTPNTFDGISDFGGTSGFTIDYGTILEVNQSVTFTDATSLSYFLNPQVELHDLQGTGFKMTAYGGNNDFMIITDKAGQVSVTYNFSAVPEPGSAVLSALGALSLLGFRRRR